MRFFYILFILFLINLNAKSQLTVWQKQQQLNKAVNISGMDYGWFSASNLQEMKSEITLASQIGFKTIRFPIAFTYWSDTLAPFAIDTYLLSGIDTLIKQCRLKQLNYILDFHKGQIESSWSFNNEVNRTTKIWRNICVLYGSLNTDSCYFELYNEPWMSTSNWNTVIKNLVDSVRVFDANQTLLVAFNKANHIDEINNLTNLSDPNLIYSIHFYEPMMFTHQGSNWVSPAFTTTNIPFPYNAATMPIMHPNVNQESWGAFMYNNYNQTGQDSVILNYLIKTKNWQIQHNKPIHLGEFGVYAPAPLNGITNYMYRVRSICDSLLIPWTVWEFNGGFGLFNASPPTLTNFKIGLLCSLGFSDFCFTSNLFENSIHDELVSIFPNPSTGIITLELKEENYQIKIFDQRGKKEKKEFNGTGNLQLNISELNNGFYYVYFVSRNKAFFKKLIKQ